MTLVIQPLPGIGDMVWHASHIRALAAMEPGGRITLLTKRRSLGDRLFAGEGIVEQVLWLERNPGRHDGLPGLVRLAAMLRPYRFRRAVILHKDPYYAAACMLAGIPERLGYGQKLRCFLTRGPFLPAALHGAPHIQRAHAFLAALGCADDLTPRLKVGQRAADIAGGVLPEAALPALALGIGGSETDKRWAADRYARLARALVDAGWRTVVLAGGPADAGIRPVIEAALDGTGVALHDTFGFDIEQSMAVIARCALFIGNDSGALNIAAALQVPTVGLFGATRPLSYATNLHPVLGDDERSPGMSGISVEQVLAAVGDLAAAGAVPPLAVARSPA